MIKKDYLTEYQIIKIIKKEEHTKTYLVRKNCISFENIIKKIDISKLKDKEVDELEQEVKITSSLKSDFILKIEDYFQSKNKLKNFYIVSEYFESMTLVEFLEKEKNKNRLFIKEDIIWKIFIQLCLAFYNIHSNNIILRNINSSTVLLNSQFEVKIRNFKNSFLLDFENDLCTEEVYNNEYSSPEIIKKEPYNTKSDVWSLGVLLYEICTFTKPFKGENKQELYKNITNGIYKKIGNKYSKELTELIYKMLKVKYQERISISDIINEEYFISMSKKMNLYYYVKKGIKFNKKFVKGKLIQNNKIINRDYDKKLKSIKNNLIKIEEKEKIKANIKNLAKKYFEIKKNVEDIIGKQKSDKLFEELTQNNINEIITRYTFEFINSEIYEKLKILLIEFLHISRNFSNINIK